MNPFVTRRSAIKGLTLSAGVSVLEPLLSQLTAQAAGGTNAVRQRFVFVVQSNGMNPNHIVPVGLPARRDQELFPNEATVETPLADRELPAAIAELTPFKDRLTLLQGLSGRVALRPFVRRRAGHSRRRQALAVLCPRNREQFRRWPRRERRHSPVASLKLSAIGLPPCRSPGRRFLRGYFDNCQKVRDKMATAR